MGDIEQITSKQAKEALPVDIINLLWYVWETEYNGKEIQFTLETSCEPNKQNITVFINDKAVKMFAVKLDNAVNAVIIIETPKREFIMDIKK